MNIKILKPIDGRPGFKVGRVVSVTTAKGLELIGSGHAELSKDIADDEVVRRKGEQLSKEIESASDDKEQIDKSVEEVESKKSKKDGKSS